MASVAGKVELKSGGESVTPASPVKVEQPPHSLQKTSPNKLITKAKQTTLIPKTEAIKAKLQTGEEKKSTPEHKKPLIAAPVQPGKNTAAGPSSPLAALTASVDAEETETEEDHASSGEDDAVMLFMQARQMWAEDTKTIAKRKHGGAHKSATKKLKRSKGEKTELAYKCTKCSFKTLRKGTFNVHVRSHLKPTLRCDHCDFRCETRKLMNKHQFEHSNLEVLKCPDCDYTAFKRGNLVAHMRTHSGLKPFKCDLCPYRAKVKGKLTRHSRTHTGDKPHSCTHCAYSATTKSNLTRHFRTRHPQLALAGVKKKKRVTSKKKAAVVA